MCNMVPERYSRYNPLSPSLSLVSLSVRPLVAVCSFQTPCNGLPDMSLGMFRKLCLARQTTNDVQHPCPLVAVCSFHQTDHRRRLQTIGLINLVVLTNQLSSKHSVMHPITLP